MREFFRSRKRKLGVVTLVLACVFMVGWVRNDFDIHDGIFLNSGKRSYRFSSLDGMRFFWIDRDEDSWPGPFLHYQSGDYGYMRENERIEHFANYNTDWRWEWAGFHFGAGWCQEVTKKWHMEYYAVPYWSLVVPLTLLSAYLLLSKPRNAAKVPA